MNLVLVTSEFPNSQFAATGGIGTYAQNLVSGLTRKGHKIFLITNGHKEIKYIQGNITVFNAQVRLKLLEYLIHKLPSRLFTRLIKFIIYPVLFQIGVMFTLIKLNKTIKIDIIEANDFAGELFLYLLFVKKHPPVVLRLHTPSFVLQQLNNEPFNLFYRLMKLFEIYCLKNADSLYSPSNSLAKIITKEIKKSVKTVIPYPFKSVHYDSRIERKPNLVLYVGKLQFKKGVFDLISAIPEVIEKLPGTKFIFVGPDTLYNGLSVRNLLISNALKNKLFNNVIFHSDSNKKKLFKLYRQSTIVVIPSIWENFPNVCLEAMANGALVIARKSGGLAEIIKHNINGILIMKSEPHYYAEAIEKYLTSPEKRHQISSRAYQSVTTTYKIDTVSNLTVNHYRKVILSRQ